MLLKTCVSVSRSPNGALVIKSPMIEAELEHEVFNNEFVDLLIRTRDPYLALTLPKRCEIVSADFLGFLKEHRLILELDPKAVDITAQEAAKVLSKDLDYWAETLYADAFWDGILTDRQCINLMYAWAVENFHYSSFVLNHLGTVIEHVKTRVVMNRCIQHLREEWDHPRLFRSSARRFGRAVGQEIDVKTGVPLGSTLVLQYILRRAARHHIFSYKGCVAVLEKTAYRIEKTREYYKQAADFHGLPYEVVKPLVLHAETDETYDHLNSLHAFADIHSRLSMDVVRAAFMFAHVFADALYLWQRHMMEWYLSFPAGQGARLL